MFGVGCGLLLHLSKQRQNYDWVILPLTGDLIVRAALTLTEKFFVTIAEDNRKKYLKTQKFIGGIFSFFFQRSEQRSEELLAFL